METRREEALRVQEATTRAIKENFGETPFRRVVGACESLK